MALSGGPRSQTRRHIPSYKSRAFSGVISWNPKILVLILPLRLSAHHLNSFASYRVIPAQQGSLFFPLRETLLKTGSSVRRTGNEVRIRALLIGISACPLTKNLSPDRLLRSSFRSRARARSRFHRLSTERLTQHIDSRVTLSVKCQVSSIHLSVIFHPYLTFLNELLQPCAR